MADKRLQVIRNHFQAPADEDVEHGVAGMTLVSSQVRNAGPSKLQITDTRTHKTIYVEVSEGNTIRAADLKQLKGGDGTPLRTYDPGYVNTAACISRISYIDGGAGILRYRGYPIEQLAEQSNFLEVAYLLMYGNLPDKRQVGTWRNAVMSKSALPEAVVNVMAALPKDAHPMGAMVAGISALGLCYPEQNPAFVGSSVYKSRAMQDRHIQRLIGAVPAIAAHAFHRSTGKAVPTPEMFAGYTHAFLTQINGGQEPHPVLARSLDAMFVLHAEHEMNCSTAACRHLASSGVDVYTAVAGAVGALYGPLHGGANEAVLRMLERIGHPGNIPAFLQRVKAKEEKLFGFGHRVYKSFDPRAKVIRRIAEDVFRVTQRSPLIDLALQLMEAARTDPYFQSRHLYPNVDFFSGLVYKAMGFPPTFFTVLFAIPRVAGYLAHWREQLDDPDVKIIRPQQDYRGVMYRDYEDIEVRPPAKSIS